MSIKATVIGAAPDRPATQPTRVGGLSEGFQPKALGAPSLVPTTIQATAPAREPGIREPSTKPTTLAMDPPTQNTPVVHHQASALPGTQRKPLAVSLADLGRRFPGLAPEMATRLQGLLAGISPENMDAGAWLSFGTPAQEAAAQLVKSRLQLMESAETRNVTQHLTRLQALLGLVLDAMGGGLFKKSPQKVWAEVSAEVRQLESLLSNAYPKLMALTASFDALVGKNQEVMTGLAVHALAAEFLADRVAPQSGSLLVSRIAALSTSQALAHEQIQTLELDKTTVQELTVLVQDGVLLKLPAVYSQLADFTTKPSETQRFMAAEQLSELVHHLQRNL